MSAKILPLLPRTFLDRTEKLLILCERVDLLEAVFMIIYIEMQFNRATTEKSIIPPNHPVLLNTFGIVR